MNQRQQNFITMLRTVLQLLNTKSNHWNSSKPIINIVTKLNALSLSISENGKLQTEKSTNGHTEDKAMQFDNMFNVTFRLARKLTAYGKLNRDSVLLKAVDHSMTDLKRGSIEDQITLCQIILDKGQSYLPKLADFDITAATLTEVDAAIKNVRPLTSKRDSLGKERSTITDNITEQINQTKEQLDILDDLINSVVKDKDFVSTYNKSRTIVER